jgi:hypothetical protein
MPYRNADQILDRASVHAREAAIPEISVHSLASSRAASLRPGVNATHEETNSCPATTFSGSARFATTLQPNSLAAAANTGRKSKNRFVTCTNITPDDVNRDA